VSIRAIALILSDRAERRHSRNPRLVPPPPDEKPSSLMTAPMGGDRVGVVESTARQQQLTVRVLTDEPGWDAIRPQWDALHASAPSASTPLDFSWMRLWWSVFGSTYGAGGLRIITVWKGEGLVAVLPLYIRVQSAAGLGLQCLRFISTGEAQREETCPEYLGLLCAPGLEADCATAVWDAIGAIEWDVFDAVDVDAESALMHAQALPSGAITSVRGVCPVADLTGGFDAYLHRLPGKYRQQARRKLRDAEEAVSAFEVVESDRVPAAFDDLMRLHQARWIADGKPGVFSEARFVEFHRRLLADWVPRRRAVLCRLSVGNDTIAMHYGFLTRHRFELYQSGTAPDAAGSVGSPGIAAHLLLMQALAAEGVTAYDFLSGAAAYKDRLATSERQLVGFRVWRPTLRAAVYRSMRWAGRAARNAVRRRPRSRA
jgi:CelD/BcsL family acetyltransferase involved in cellulose biosynthesis